MNWLTIWVPPTGVKKCHEHSFYMFRGLRPQVPPTGTNEDQRVPMRTSLQRVPPTGARNFTSIHSTCSWVFCANGCLQQVSKISRAFCLGFCGVSLGSMGSRGPSGSNGRFYFRWRFYHLRGGVEIKLNGRVLSGPPDLFCTPLWLDRTSDQPRS
jgi:hypothetical protein